MPYLHIHTNVSIADEADFLKRCSALAAEVLGKPESYVMISLSHGKTMMFAGSEDPLAYIELKSLSLPGESTGSLSAALSAILAEVLEIPPARVYIEFTSPERHMWGWDGGTF